MDRLAKSEEKKLAGKYEKALEMAEQILIDDPACIEAAEEVADNLLSLERFDAAKKAAEFVLKHRPESYIAHFVIGFLASDAGDWKTAIAHFQKADAGQKNNPEILRCLGWALFQSGKKTDGLAILNRALTLRPDDPAILTDLAAIFIEEDRLNEAKHFAQKALDLDPADDRAADLIALIDEISRS